MRLLIILWVISQLTSILPTIASENPQKPLKILRITPTGEDVPNERQITFTFNQTVVPLGRMERDVGEIPITITPALVCQWRWLNTTTLTCQLDEKKALRPATRYQITVNPGIKTETQQTLQKSIKHTFITRRPAVSHTTLDTWKAPGMPVVRVYFNQPVTQASVETQLIYVQKDNGRKTTIIATPLSDESSKKPRRPAKTAKTWLISPKTLLPLDTTLKLQVTPGVVSTLGSERGVENRVVTTVDTFPKFKFLGVSCTTLSGIEVDLAAHETWSKRCDPLGGVFLKFSSPVIKAVIRDNLMISPALTNDASEDPWAQSSSHSFLDQDHQKDQTYYIMLPAMLKAFATYELKGNKLAFKDEFGRTLPTSIDLQFATDHRKPDYVFEHNFSVLETGVDSEVPLYVTNLNELTFNYQWLTNQGWSEKHQKKHVPPQVQDVAFKIPLGIRDLLPTPSGLVQGYFITQPNVRNEDARQNNWFFSQVTPFYIQAKVGYHNTLVWVTDFATGLPVADAKLSIYQATYANPTAKVLATAVTDAQGIALLPGTETLDPKLELTEAYNRERPRLFIHCEHAEAIALLPLDYEFRVQVYDIIAGDYSLYPYRRQQYGHMHTWGTTAQGVYKVGDTVQYKIFVRDQSNTAFIAAPLEKYTLEITDPTGKTIHEAKDLRLSEFGTFAGTFEIPKTAAVGWYYFQLKANFTEETWQPMRVLVSDFTPSPFRVQTTLDKSLLHMGETVHVDTQATLHAGGPYADASTRVTATLNQQPFTSEHPQTKGFTFDVYVENLSNAEVVHQSEARIDSQGQLRTALTLPTQSKVLYGRLNIESAVQDDRGKQVAHRASVPYVGRDRFVGLKVKDWLWTAGQKAAVQLLVVDEYGQPVTDTAVKVNIARRETKAARVKGAGNAYLTQYQHRWVATGKCDIQPITVPIACTFTPKKAGSYKLTAQIKDRQGRTHETALWQWALGSDAVVWETPEGNGLEISPEQTRYAVGETARYLVKNPFPGAQALVTVERFGVMKQWVTMLPSSLEVIEVPVMSDYVPGFFVSVTVMSPRVDKPLGANQVDLGKPTFRMGYVKTAVKDPYKELTVAIQTDKPVYRPREQVTATLQVNPRNPFTANTTPPVELAVTVLDEAVFDLLLAGRRYFDPYQGFYALDDLDVVNFSLLMRLVGRQKFEKKGANAGGDGGSTLGMRSLFKFVSYWNPAIQTDATGKAEIQFTIPDNLTGWRILAMAVTPTDRMGLGDANFKVNQPIEIRPILPNQVIQGDRFQAGFSIMNRTDKLRQLDVVLGAKGPVNLADCPKDLTQCGRTQTLTATPYQRYPVWLPLETTEAGTIELTAFAQDTEEKDSLRTTLTVHKRRSLMTAATYGTLTDVQADESILFPEDIYTDVGGLAITISPTVIGDVENAFEYMRDYPYACWEQKLTKGTMASYYQKLQPYLKGKLVWQQAPTLSDKTLKLATNYQAPNGGMAYYIPEDRRVSPYLSAYTALAFNWLRKNDHVIPDKVENRLHEYLATLLRKDDVLPRFYVKGMAETVRAAALAALAVHGKVSREAIQRYHRHVPQMDLFGQALFLQAALQVPQTEQIRSELLDLILSHMDQTAGKVTFQENLDEAYSHLLSSSLRTQCTLLSSLVSYQSVVGPQSTISDLPLKLTRQITTARKSGGHWYNTQENMFCMNALLDYARLYEQDKPDMVVQSWLDAEELGKTTFSDIKDPPVTFNHEMTLADKGRSGTVKLTREGTGRLYYTLRMHYALLAEKATAINAGMEVHREYYVERKNKWTQLQSPMHLKTGELVRVDLYLSLPAARYFVVVDDPVPGGLEPVNRDLATASQVDADKAKGQYAGGSWWFKHEDWLEYGSNFWSFYHKELRHDAARFYADYLPAGNYHLSYVAQAIAPGEFSVMPTHAEEMYEPDVYGKSAPAMLTVTRGKAATSK